jgi:hypothetical protein
MKKTLIIAALTLFVGSAKASMPTQTEKDDTTFVFNGRQIVVNDSDGFTRVKVYDMERNEYKPMYEGHFSDTSEEEVYYIRTVFAPDSYRKSTGRYSPLIPGVYLGIGSIAGTEMGIGNNKAMHLSGISVLEDGISLLSMEYSNGRRGWGVTHTLDLISYTITFQKGWAITNDENYEVTMLQSEDSKRGHVVNLGARMTEMLHYCWPLGKDRFALGLGCSMGLQDCIVSYKMKDGERHRDACSADLRTHQFNFGLDFRMSWNGIMLYAHKQLTPLFDTHHAPRAYPFTVGLGISF